MERYELHLAINSVPCHITVVSPANIPRASMPTMDLFSMSISSAQLGLWQPGSSTRQYFTDVGIHHAQDGDYMIIKQSSELYTSTSFAAYTVPCSSYTYLGTENLSAETKVIRLRLNEPITASTYIDNNMSSERMEDEEVSLQMGCPILQTSLSIGTNINLMLPRTSSLTEWIAQDLATATPVSRGGKYYIEESMISTDTCASTHESASITLSNDDLDHLEGRGRASQPMTAVMDTGKDTSKWINNPRYSRRPRRKLNQHLRTVPTEAPDPVTGARVEESLVAKWNKSQEVWAELSRPKSRKSAQQTEIASCDPGINADGDSKSQWATFAIQHGAQTGYRGAAPCTASNKVDLATTLPGSSSRDFSALRRHPQTGRHEDKQASSRKGLMKQAHVKRAWPQAIATFIPPTNSSMMDRHTYE